MQLPPYTLFPTITGNTISLREILPADIRDIIAISFYDAVQSTTIKQAAEMQPKINKDYKDGSSIHWASKTNLPVKLSGLVGTTVALTEKGNWDTFCCHNIVDRVL